MKGIVLASGMIAALALLSGCAHHIVDGNGSVINMEFPGGNVGVTGSDNTITIARGSRVWKLSIIADNNNITVEDGVTVNAIEFIGKGNVVNIPDNLLPRVTEIGNNQIIRRPAQRRSTDVYLPAEPLPPLETTAPPPASRAEPRPEPPQPKPGVEPPPPTEMEEPPPK